MNLFQNSTNDIDNSCNIENYNSDHDKPTNLKDSHPNNT